MRTIYLSPHLDDAVFSCGGMIWKQASRDEKVEIWTVCAGDPPDGPLSPYAELLHVQWGTGREAPAVRRQEDRAACRIMGAAYRHLSFQDCIYRRSPDGEWLYDAETLNGELKPVDEAQVETLVEFLVLSLHADDRLLCPLTVGSHVDHRLVRRAAERSGHPLAYYVDMPYILRAPSSVEPLVEKMKAANEAVGKDGLKAWMDAVAAYTSQISSYWCSMEAMKEEISAYGINGIPIWSPRPGLL